MSRFCHQLVAKIAREAAGELYEKMMGIDGFFSAWKAANPSLSAKALEAKFVATRWPACIPFARATLAQLLTNDLDPAVKDDIMEALVLDSSLRQREGHWVAGKVERRH